MASRLLSVFRNSCAPNLIPTRVILARVTAHNGPWTSAVPLVSNPGLPRMVTLSSQLLAVGPPSTYWPPTCSVKLAKRTRRIRNAPGAAAGVCQMQLPRGLPSSGSPMTRTGISVAVGPTETAADVGIWVPGARTTNSPSKARVCAAWPLAAARVRLVSHIAWRAVLTSRGRDASASALAADRLGCTIAAAAVVVPLTGST